MGYDIIFIADEAWSGSMWRRRHNVAWCLAKDNRVYFIEPPTRTATRRICIKHEGRNLYSVALKRLFPDITLGNKINLSWLNQIFVRANPVFIKNNSNPFTDR